MTLPDDDPAALAAWCRSEGRRIADDLRRLGMAYLELELRRPVDGESNAVPVVGEGVAIPPTPQWYDCAMRNWMIFDGGLNSACLLILRQAGVPLPARGIADLLARSVGLPHPQEDQQFGARGYDTLKSAISSALGRLADKRQVIRSGKDPIQWSLPSEEAIGPGGAQDSSRNALD